MKQHLLKTDPIVYDEVAKYNKKYEIRFNDRNFHNGDQLILLKTLFSGEDMKNGAELIYTGNAMRVRVTHILYGPIYGLQEGWAIMSIDPMG
jgi:hypothetical protein